MLRLVWSLSLCVHTVVFVPYLLLFFHRLRICDILVQIRYDTCNSAWYTLRGRLCAKLFMTFILNGLLHVFLRLANLTWRSSLFSTHRLLPFLNHGHSRWFSFIQEKNTLSLRKSVFGDPYEIRTRDAAVKGRSLNHLTNGPSGSDNWIRTNDTAGMNRML